MSDLSESERDQLDHLMALGYTRMAALEEIQGEGVKPLCPECGEELWTAPPKAPFWHCNRCKRIWTLGIEEASEDEGGQTL